MPDEGFFKRWSRRKAEAEQGHELPPEPVAEPVLAPAPSHDPVPAPVYARAGVHAYAPAHVPAPAPAPAPADGHAPARAAEPAPAPTMADVALLTPESDFSAFVRQGVDADVRRTALKKLFTDPHFNTMDRLDVYIDDYNKPSPVSEAMLASLRHAKSVFRHLAEDDEIDANAGADAGAGVEQTTLVPQAQPAPPEAERTQDPSAAGRPAAADAAADAAAHGCGHIPTTST